MSLIFRFLFLLTFSSLFNFIQAQNSWESNKAKPNGNGCLTYEEDGDKNRIPNFSHAGYRGGGVKIPTISIKKIISPVSGDNTANIQNAIDSIAALPIQSNGYRGTLFLNPGRYPVSGQLKVNASGIVLKGAGDGRNGSDTTIIYGTGNIPAQRNLITLGGGTNTQWNKEVANTRQNITSSFVQVGSYSFEIQDASGYAIGDNIVIYHPCSNAWLNAINFGETASDPNWTENSYPILYNRYITDIQGTTITIDAPVYNHLDRALSQSYIYKHNDPQMLEKIGFEDIRVEIESLGGNDENHVWNALQLTQVENAWVRNSTFTGFGLSGVRTETVNHISVVNVHSIDPVAIVTGGRMYNFNSYTCSNNILFDNCYANNGRHHYVSNGVASVSGFVVLNSISENSAAASEGHRHWTTGMLFDNLKDVGSYNSTSGVMAFYNRGDYGSSHGWSAAHSVFWNCDASRPGKDAGIVVEKPPTAQNYAIGCKGKIGFEGPFNKTKGHIEGSNSTQQLHPKSLYEAQLLCRKATVLSDFESNKQQAAKGEIVTYSSNSQGNITNYSWDFGSGAVPSTAIGIGPHEVKYSTEGLKTVSLKVSNQNEAHTEQKSSYLSISSKSLFAVNDQETLIKNDSITTSIVNNDFYPDSIINFARSFNGSSDKITYSSSTLLDDFPFTASLWVKTLSNNNQVLLYNGNKNSGVTGNSISIKSGKANLEAWLYDGSTSKLDINGTTILNDGQWHHLAAVFNSSTDRKLYVDGVLEGTDTRLMNNLTVQNFNHFSIGNRDDSSPGDWTSGTIDEVKLHASALSVQEINQLIEGTACLQKEEVLHWSFNDQNNLIAKDESNYFDGTISGSNTVLSFDYQNNLKAKIIQQPKNGTATLSSNFTISYRPYPNFIGLDTLSYQIKAGNCDSSEAVMVYQVDDITGVQLANSPFLSFYPNPSQGQVEFSQGLLNETNTSKTALLFTQEGKLMKELTIKKNIDLSDLQNGIYFLQFRLNNQEVISKKLIITK